MKKIYFATTNKGKFKTFRDSMKRFSINVIRIPLDMPEPRSDDVDTIAREKVMYAFSKIKKPCVATDAGFYIKSLNGFPKAFVNFALTTIGIDGILKLAEGKSRECEFRHSVAYMDGRLSKPKSFNASIKGALIDSRRGTMKDFLWSELCLIVVPEGSRKTMAEMSKDELYAWGSRSHADEDERKFANFFLKRKKEQS